MFIFERFAWMRTLSAYHGNSPSSVSSPLTIFAWRTFLETPQGTSATWEQNKNNEECVCHQTFIKQSSFFLKLKRFLLCWFTVGEGVCRPKLKVSQDYWNQHDEMSSTFSTCVDNLDGCGSETDLMWSSRSPVFIHASKGMYWKYRWPSRWAYSPTGYGAAGLTIFIHSRLSHRYGTKCVSSPLPSSLFKNTSVYLSLLSNLT